ncbi:hypothetical protein BDV32DRAFT_144000 [Aspergillus pseudonomiae]|uniref:Uncharacterized protein n=1 Tax=Aspergillus pseudonomiae TaxID=1506151 RepID=A0A5N7DE19_9EURO|nr:uncharacterized protein BDV37DRAFT_282728 [Aspergillus pseudonomiae]KAB8266279.1 hypothetical protein BDV32DRAFT_144000 [Aspergillus pseudonomiae]KAE8404435.1 hypothetical protein BDV37DRAFT_282728 [Aspergillus pseudonomiae]
MEYVSIHLFPAREAFMRCNVKVPNEEGLVPLVGTFTDLQTHRLILNVPAVSDVFQNALICPDKDVQEQLARYNNAGTDHVLDDWRGRWCLGSWRVNFACYGPPAVVDAVFRVIESEFYKFRGAILTQSKYVAKPGQILNPDETGEELLPQNGAFSVAGIAAVNMREDSGGHAASSLIRPYLYE